MGQQKGNPTPSYQNQAYETLRPNTNARENRDYGTKPVMIDDNTTINDYIDLTFDTDAVAAMVSASLNTTIYAVSASIGNNITAVSASINTNIYAISSSIDSYIATKANLASPTFTGTPASTTAAVGTNTAQVATTAFVIAEKLRLIYAADDATIAVSAAVNNKVFIATKASGTQTFTLPAASYTGLQYTFICGNVGGEIKILGSAGDTINCKAANAGASVSVAANTGIKNTAATNVLGDTITLVSDGITTWYGIAQSGIFASN